MKETVPTKSFIDCYLELYGTCRTVWLGGVHGTLFAKKKLELDCYLFSPPPSPPAQSPPLSLLPYAPPPLRLPAPCALTPFSLPNSPHLFLPLCSGPSDSRPIPAVTGLPRTWPLGAELVEGTHNSNSSGFHRTAGRKTGFRGLDLRLGYGTAAIMI